MTQQRVLAALGVVVLVAIIGGVAALAMGGGDDTSVSAPGASTSRTPASVPATTPTTGSAPPTSAPTSVTVGIICSTPEEAAVAFVDGWKAGDRAAAERCGGADAVATMFQTDGAGAQYASQGCDLSDPGVPVCFYSYPGGSTALTIEGTEAAGWKVTKVVFTAD